MGLVIHTLIMSSGTHRNDLNFRDRAEYGKESSGKHSKLLTIISKNPMQVNVQELLYKTGVF